MPITESALRARLSRQGYSLHKSRTRNENHPSFGMYWIRDPTTRVAVAGQGPFGPNLDLEDVIEWTSA